MKTKYLLLLGANLLLSTFTSVLAQSTWQTVDNLAKSRGVDIVADNYGTFFSLAIDDGTGGAGPVSTAVSVSDDRGVTWQTVGLIAGYALDLTVAPDGALFATGNRSATVLGRAFLWQSLDRGHTWTISDPSTGLFVPMLVLDVAAGNNGAIYICGYSGSTWLVRKGQRTVGGNVTWTTSDTLPGQPDSICVRPAAVAGQADEVLVCGRSSGFWTVRRSVNSGAAWATADSYAADMLTGYSGVATGPNGSIFVVGRVARTITTYTIVKKKTVASTATEYGLLVRKSANNGATWTNADYLVNGWPGNAPITVDSFGRVFVVGFNNGATQTWLVRASADGGSTWVTTDSFVPSGSDLSHAQAVASDLPGNVCVVGETKVGTSLFAPIRTLSAIAP